MTAAINPEDMALHNKKHIEQAIEELARRLPGKDQTEAFITAMGASLHYIFEIAAERYGYPGVSFFGAYGAPATRCTRSQARRRTMGSHTILRPFKPEGLGFPMKGVCSILSTPFSLRGFAQPLRGTVSPRASGALVNFCHGGKKFKQGFAARNGAAGVGGGGETGIGALTRS